MGVAGSIAGPPGTSGRTGDHMPARRARRPDASLAGPPPATLNHGMPSDAIVSPGRQPRASASAGRMPAALAVGSDRTRRQVSWWLFAICFMLLGMIALGGATRLTGSGLSIMEWAPLSGIVPPLTHAQWEHLFALYQRIPQYRLEHQGFGLSGFQHIFWLEWIHRFWGRTIGIVLIVPLAVFAARRAIGPRLIARLLLFFVLGGLQGAIGWFMVASGFDPDSVAVAPAKLVLHLCFAFALYAAILWTAFSVRWPVPLAIARTRGAAWTRRLAASAACVLAVTVVAGRLHRRHACRLRLQHLPRHGRAPDPVRLRRAAPVLAQLVPEPGGGAVRPPRCWRRSPCSPSAPPCWWACAPRCRSRRTTR